MPEQIGKIFSAIPAIMSEIEAISKAQKNKDQNFMYRGIDDIYNSLHPLLAKHKVFTVPEIIKTESSERTSRKGSLLLYEIYDIKYHFYTIDGSCVSATVRGIGMDSGDKAGNKAMAIAHKYALLQIFAIPTSDEKDPDGQSYELQPGKNENGTNKKTEPNNTQILKNKRVRIGKMLTAICNNDLQAAQEMLAQEGYESRDQITTIELANQIINKFKPEFSQRFDWSTFEKSEKVVHIKQENVDNDEPPF